MEVGRLSLLKTRKLYFVSWAKEQLWSIRAALLNLNAISGKIRNLQIKSWFLRPKGSLGPVLNSTFGLCVVIRG